MVIFGVSVFVLPIMLSCILIYFALYVYSAYKV